MRLFRFFRLFRSRGAAPAVAWRRAWERIRQQDLPLHPTAKRKP